MPGSTKETRAAPVQRTATSAGKQRTARCFIPQAPTLAKVRSVFEEVAEGNVNTAAISTKTRISPRHVNYQRHAIVELGLAESRDGPATPSGRKLLRAEAGSDSEKRALVEAISTSPLTQKLGIDVVSFQPPTRQHLLARCIEVCPGVSRATLQHRVGDMLSWRVQLGIDLEPATTASGSRQMSLAEASQTAIPPDLATNLWRINPWWVGHATRSVPPFRRTFTIHVSTALHHGLARVVVVRGPRQVGKTTAQEQLISDLFREKTPPKHILRVQFDSLPSLSTVAEPILRIVDWYERCVLERTLNEVARDGHPAFIFLDEVQNVKDWAIQLKHLVDHTDVHVLVTGSSALHLEEGTDSLAGRVKTIDVGTLSLSEIARVRDDTTLPTILGDSSSLLHLADRQLWTDLVSQGARHRTARDQAFQAFSTYGGYPLAHAHADVPWEHVASQLNQTVIKGVVAHDLQTSVRAKQLDLRIEEVFRLCCRYAGQVPAPGRLAKNLGSTGNGIKVEDLREALSLLERALLVRLVPPLEMRLRNNRDGQKLCLIDHALRASWFGEIIPLVPEQLWTQGLTDVAGHLVESVVGTHLLGLQGLNLTHFPAKGTDPEVDFVITAGANRIPVEIKYRRTVKPTDFDGIQHFVRERRNNAPFGILVTQHALEGAPDDVIIVPLSTLLMLH